MWPNPQFPADLATFAKEILNGKLHFLYSVWFAISKKKQKYHYPCVRIAYPTGELAEAQDRMKLKNCRKISKMGADNA